MNKDNIKEYIVCLNGGSGVIFQPKDELYSYILTAKHVLENDEGILITECVNIYFYNKENLKFEIIKEYKLIPKDNYFPHKNLKTDIAIIKIDRINTEGHLFTEDKAINNDSIVLGGFPHVRIKGTIDNDSYRLDSISEIKQSKENNQIEAQLKIITTHGELIGQSGGGIFSLDSSSANLQGIQNKIPEADDEEQLGFINYTPISVFNEIIEEYNDKLEELIPPYLKSFSFLKDDVFTFPTDLITKETIDKITHVFEVKTQELIKCDFTPNCIKEFLDVTELLIHNQKEEELNKKTLWLIWLELLTILNIVKNKKHVKSDFNELFSQVRLLHSSTDKDFWVENIDDVAKTNFGNLLEDGLVVVSSKQAPHREHYILNTSAIPKIDEIRFTYESADMPYGKENNNISSGSSFPFDNFQFIHVEYFKQKTIVDEYSDYSELTHTEILELLKNKYEQIFK